jgi:hypothetical protein
LDVANWMLGALPRRVMATGGIDYWRDGREVPDNVFCVYEYPVTPPAADRESVSKEPYTVRVTYSSLCNNAFEGASEPILGTRGTLFLTERKGLLYAELNHADAAWAIQDAAQENAAVITSGKTLGMSNDPWAHRSKPVEIDNEQGDETREQLVSFLDHVRRRDPQTLCDARAGLANVATVLMANEAVHSGRPIEFPREL